MPLIPRMRPFIRKVWSGKVWRRVVRKMEKMMVISRAGRAEMETMTWLRTVIIGLVRSPQAKNSRKMTTRAW